jgi:putative ABC transport system permease protein
MRLQHIIRRLLRAPLFTGVIVATLALGIGANTAIFSVIEGVLIKPLPYPNPQELIGVWHSATGINIPLINIAPSLYFTYREQSRTFSDIGAWQGYGATVTGLGDPHRVDCISVTSGLLPVLGVQPILGRWFSSTDGSPGSPDTVMLTYGYWQSRFGGAPSVIGRRIVVDGTAREIIGVMPASFRFLDLKPGLITPLVFERNKVTLGNFSYQGIARLKPGVTLSQASADVARMLPLSFASFPPPPGFNVKMFEEAQFAPKLRPLKQDLIGDAGKVLWVVMGTLGLLLLIACANVANLLLVRADAREHELAIRAALGAGWAQVARELMLESVVLGLLGGIAAVGLAWGALRLLVATAPAYLPRIEEISIDTPVLLFTLAISLLAGLLFGAIPVIKYAGPHLTSRLRGGGRTSSQSRDRHRTRSILAGVQIALATVLLIASGLMIRTFRGLTNVAPGFTHAEQVQTLRISIPQAQVKDPAAVVRMQQDIMDKIAAIPGVTSAAFASVVPMDGGGWTDPIFAEDHVYSESQVPPLRRFKFASPGLTKTMGGSLVAGRDLTWTDSFEKRPVALVSENVARELWRDPASAIGKRIRESGKSPWREVVGVVSDERDDGVDQKATSIIIFPALMDNFEGNLIQAPRSVAYVVRSGRTGTESFMREIRHAVWSVNANLPLAEVRTLQEIYSKSLSRTSFALSMLGIAGGMALLLGMVGIYGVLSYSVAQRTREIGIRMALGATRGGLTGIFLRHGLLLAAGGIACGLAAAFGLMRLIGALLFAVSPVDPLTYAAVAIALAAATLLASCLPAWRAAAIDPMDALRAD